LFAVALLLESDSNATSPLQTIYWYSGMVLCVMAKEAGIAATFSPLQLRWFSCCGSACKQALLLSLT
jgi:hypothetical protein